MPVLWLGWEADVHGACDKAVPELQGNKIKEAEKGIVISKHNLKERILISK